MKTRETELRAEVDRWLEAAEAADAQGTNSTARLRRGDKCPAGSLTSQKRLAKIRDADRRLRRRPRPRQPEQRRNAEAEKRKRSGPVPRPPSGPIKAQHNFTDPDSHRVLPDQGRLHPGLQRAASTVRRDQANHRSAWTDAEHERLSAACSPGRRRPGQPPTQAQKISRRTGYCSEVIFWRSRPGESTPIATGRNQASG